MVDTETRIKALSDYLGVEVKEGYTENYFETEDGEEYWVLTEEEAYGKAKEYIKDFLKAAGYKGFTLSFQEHILNNCLDEDSIEETLEEYIEEKFNYSSDEDIIEEASSNLDVELYDDEGELKEDIDIDNLREQLIDREKEILDSEGVIEYADNDFDGLENLIDIDLYIDEDRVAEDCIEWDGVAPQLALYDSDEIELEDDLYAYRTN